MKLTEEVWSGLVATHGDRLLVVDWSGDDEVVVGPPLRDPLAAWFDAQGQLGANDDASQLSTAEHNLALESCVWPERAALVALFDRFPRAPESVAQAAVGLGIPEKTIVLQRIDGVWKAPIASDGDSDGEDEPVAASEPVSPEVSAQIDRLAKGGKVWACFAGEQLVVMGQARASRYSACRSLSAEGKAFESAESYALGGRLFPDADAWKALAATYPGLVTMAGAAVRGLGSPGVARISKAPRFSKAP